MHMFCLGQRSDGSRQHRRWFNRVQSGLIFAAVIWVSAAHAATWYAAVDGGSTNGTYANPWSVEYAAGKTPNSYLKPGDTVLFKPGGPWRCPEWAGYGAITNNLIFRISGRPSAKITYKSLRLWGFSFDGTLYLPQTSSNIVIHGFRVFSSDITNRVRFGRTGDNVATNLSSGIWELGHGNEILHNLIENHGHPGIASWASTDGKYIAGNVIRFIGYDDYSSEGAGGASRGSGMYLQNADNSSEALINGNISYFNYTTGMKAYGNINVYGFNFAQNILCDNSEAGIFYHLNNSGSKGLIVRSNYLWEKAWALRIGYVSGVGGHSNAAVTGNYSVDHECPFSLVNGWKYSIWTNNTGVNVKFRKVWALSDKPSGDLTTDAIDYNAYYAIDTADPWHPFYYGDPNAQWPTGFHFTDWQAQIRGDIHSMFTYGLPSNVVVHVFAPSTDRNFVHVSVFNWPTNVMASVDLSGYFNSGDKLKIYDAQELPSAYTNFTYAGGLTPFDLTRTNIANMVGTFPQRPDKWSGFDPRFRAFVVYRDTPTLGSPKGVQAITNVPPGLGVPATDLIR